jgi:hypothetical protein
VGAVEDGVGVALQVALGDGADVVPHLLAREVLFRSVAAGGVEVHVDEDERDAAGPVPAGEALAAERQGVLVGVGLFEVG